MQNYQPEARKLDLHRYEDRSLFRYGLTYVTQHQSLNKFITENIARGNILAFPEKDFQTCIILDRTEKMFQVWDIFGERWHRKVKKAEKPNVEDPDVFDVDLDGKVLAYICGDEIIL